MQHIPLRNRRGEIVAHALVDERDFERVNAHRWHRTALGYVGHCSGRYLHRFLLGLQRGDDVQVDHLNGDRLDNRRANLRAGDQVANMQNRRGAASGSISRFRGVTFDKRPNLRKRWIAQARVDGKNHFLGRFLTEEEAGAAAAEFRRTHLANSGEARAARG